jgi:hypothetical protein
MKMCIKVEELSDISSMQTIHPFENYVTNRAYILEASFSLIMNE